MERLIDLDRSPSRRVFLVFLSISLFFYGISELVVYPVVEGWFATLQKPSWNPPNELFGPVWGVLFLLMAIAGWVVWKKVGIQNGKKPLSLFFIQMILNLSWSLTFFRFNSLSFALLVILLLWIAVGINVLMFFQVRRSAGILMLPYWAWITFATALTYSYRVLNV
jgi:translocator protein